MSQAKPFSALIREKVIFLTMGFWPFSFINAEAVHIRGGPPCQGMRYCELLKEDLGSLKELPVTGEACCAS